MNGIDDSDSVVQAVTAMLPSGAAVRVEAATDSSDGMTSVGLHEYDLSKALEGDGNCFLDAGGQPVPCGSSIHT